MRTVFKPSVLAVSIVTALASTSVMATNGLAPTGLGQIHKAMGGAAVGNPENTTTMMTNPAAASFVSNGWDAGADLFKPNRTATGNVTFGAAQGNQVGPDITAGTEYNGDKLSAFLIPEFAYKRDLNSKTSLGISVYGNGGMNTSYETSPVFPTTNPLAPPNPGGINPQTGQPFPNITTPFNGSPTGPVGTTGVDLKQIFISPTVSMKVNENNSVGLSINLVAQQFQARGLSALSNASSSPANFTDQGKSNSTGIGATLGWMGKFGNTTAGASYRLKTKMSEFDEYKGLFPDNGRLDVPAALTVGMATMVSPKTKIAVDVQKIFYSKVNSLGNTFYFPNNPPVNGFGTAGGPGFGWDDQNVFKIGVKHQRSSKLALMAGYNHGKSPVGQEEAFVNVLTPAVVEDHLSLGVEYKLNNRASLIGSYIHTFENELKGGTLSPFDIKMDQDALGVAYSVKY